MFGLELIMPSFFHINCQHIKLELFAYKCVFGVFGSPIESVLAFVVPETGAERLLISLGGGVFSGCASPA